MANIDIRDASGVTKTLATTQSGGVDTPHHRDPEAIAALALLHTDLATTLGGFLDGLEALIGATNAGNTAIYNRLTGDPATQTTLAALLAKVIAAPSTEAKQDAGNTLLTAIAGYVDGLEAGNASILAKLSADPATQTTLAAVLAKLIAAPATEAKQDVANTLLAAATPAGENFIGAVGGRTSYIDVTLSLDTAAYASGDLMADTQVVTNAMRVNDGTGVLMSVTVIDEDDQGAAFDLILLSANNTLGAENSPPSISDANARDILGFVSVLGADFVDLGGVKIATKTGVALTVKPSAGTRNLYVATVTRGAPTYSAAGVRLRLGFALD